MKIFTGDLDARVTAWGETRIIAAIQEWLRDVGLPAPRGIGDDCAVIMPSARLLLATTDGLFFGRHFDDTATPQAAGSKLLKRNLSDIAAMGGDPHQALVALMLGPDVSIDYLKLFHEGLCATALMHHVQIVGGDITAAPAGFFGAYLTLLGDAENPISRTGAQIGDTIWVTGYLGGSILGHHLTFEPRLPEGRYLASQRAVTAMMDVTDGLAKDLRALFPLKADCTLNLAAIPISFAAQELANKTGLSSVQHAMCDGEDYELVFTLRQDVDITAFRLAWNACFTTPLHCIGYFSELLEPQRGPVFRDSQSHQPLSLWQGYEHLSS